MSLRPSRTLTVIVPILNERQNLPALLQHLNSIGAEQLILVDGGSSDGGTDWLRRHWHTPTDSMQEGMENASSQLLLVSERGRAKQMNLGARHAHGDMLVFLHADTRLPSTAKQEITEARDKNYFWGRFDVQFNPASRINQAMRVIALFMNIRSRLSSIATGDQAIFVDREVFNSARGYPVIPLMEDVALSKRLKQHGVPYCSDKTVQTSPRRWQQHGVVRTVLLMWALRLAYFAGVSPQRLARWYHNA